MGASCAILRAQESPHFRRIDDHPTCHAADPAAGARRHVRAGLRSITLGIRRPLAGILVTTALLALAVAPADAARRKRRRRRKKRPPGTVLVLGSSSMNGSFGAEIVRGLKGRGYKTWKQGNSSTGFARPDYFDWLAEVGKLPITKTTAGAVIYLGTNDAQAIHLRKSERRRLKHKGRWLRWQDRRWPKVYARRVGAFARALCRKGVHRVALLTPVSVVKPFLRKRLRQIRTGIARGARPIPCARAFSGRGDVRRILGEARRRRAAKARKGRSRKGRSRKARRKARRKASPNLRQPDGTHLTRAGARRAWKRVEGRVHSWFRRGPVPKRRARKKKRKRRRKVRVSRRR